MNEKMPVMTYEVAIARFERIIKRLWILCIILIVALIATNAGWVYYESQFATTETTIEAEQDGTGTNIVSAGDIHYGSESDSNDTE